MNTRPQDSLAQLLYSIGFTTQGRPGSFSQIFFDAMGSSGIGTRFALTIDVSLPTQSQPVSTMLAITVTTRCG